MEAAPAPTLVVPEPQFLLELLVVALDAPAQLGQVDEALEDNVLRQGGEPVLRRFLLLGRPLDQQPFLRAGLTKMVVAVRRPDPQTDKAGGQMIDATLAPREHGPCVSRQGERDLLGRLRRVVGVAAQAGCRSTPS